MKELMEVIKWYICFTKNSTRNKFYMCIQHETIRENN